MLERQTLCRLEWLPSIVDKVIRARGIQARASMGKVYFPKQAIWKEHVFSSLMRFPAGKIDDPVDVMSLIGRGLEHARPPEARVASAPGPRYGDFVSPQHSYGWMAF